MIQLEFKLKKAADFESQGKFLHAAQIYNNILLENEEYPLVYIRLSNLYERMGNSSSAIKLLKSYLDNISDDNEIRLFLGQLFLKYSMWYDAVDVLSSINSDEQPIVLFFQGYCHFMLKEYELAKGRFNEFLVNNPNTEFYVESYIYLTKINIELSLFDDALACAQKAEEITSTNWELHLVFAIAYYHKGMYLHSANSIEKAIKLSKDKIVLYEWAGKAYLKLGDYLKAENYLLEYISNTDVTSETYSYLGLACLNAQKLDDARNYFDKALSLDPFNEIALEGMKKCGE